MIFKEGLIVPIFNRIRPVTICLSLRSIAPRLEGAPSCWVNRKVSFQEACLLHTTTLNILSCCPIPAVRLCIFECGEEYAAWIWCLPDKHGFEDLRAPTLWTVLLSDLGGEVSH